MKKITLCLLAIGLSFTFSATQSQAATAVKATTVSAAAGTAESNTLMLRLNEIKGMDMSKMASGEKHTLRAEVLSIKKQMMSQSPGIFISAGALILIVLLLIILL